LPEVFSQVFQGLAILNEHSGKDCYNDVHINDDGAMETAGDSRW